MLTDGDSIIGYTMKDADFPRNYINQKHPDDLNEFTEPVCELILHTKPYHNRLIMRMSFDIGGVYIPVSFICDTGAPGSFYLSETTRLSRIAEVIQRDELDNEFVRINGKAFSVSDSPGHHPYANIMGLKALLYFGLSIGDGVFEFSNLPEHF